MRSLAPALALAAACASASGCLVMSLNPAYDGDDKASILWEPTLVGAWQNVEDNASMHIDGSEWNSYRIHYVYPAETGDLTGYLTSLGDARYLDVMPARGADRGSFVVPVHAILRVLLEGDRLELTPLSYDWFYDRLRPPLVPGLSIMKDQKENALILSPTKRLRRWLGAQPHDGRMFGASALFTRVPKS